ncbi:flavin reductase family protein [Paracoccus liaowanqingii]|uniref:Flavin reductase family protein n=1 Tax=Paracoccus liaowanqingii TaxID=2560053 RepID=A0A4P7HPK8_9RHOB|nr:flavin reductase family protein [Paracoccus liaowanqingii]QBX35690.1 flavin reductase family protein [Paracoccus liaowanqingii]
MTQATPHSFVPDPQNGRLLRDAFGRFATGVTIVTAASPEGCAAMTANSFSSISMDPPLVMWSPARASSRLPDFAAAAHFAIHVLSADQADLAWAVARNRNALDEAGLARNAQGVPVLDRCLARFDCAQFDMHEAGDHVIILGRVLHALVSEGAPLAFYGGRVAGIAPA